MIRATQCPMCKGNNLEVIRENRFFFPGAGIKRNLIDIRYERLWILFEKILKDRSPVELQVAICQSCGFIFTNPRFTAEEMSVKYAAINELGSVKKRYQVHPPLNLDARGRRIYSLTMGLRKTKNKRLRVLDYGGAWGYNLIPFVGSGSLCYILDYEKWHLPDGIEYLGEDLVELQPNELFDVVLCLHTLEHAIEPMSLLQGLSTHLSEFGLLYVEVPLGCFHECKHLAEPLTHLNFFFEESIYKGLRSIGLGIVHLSTAYQWITNGNMWCINIVASRRDRNMVTKYKTTRHQMNDLGYYWQPEIGKIVGIARRLGKRILGGSV